MTRRCEGPGLEMARAARLNRNCVCQTLDSKALDSALAQRIGGIEAEQLAARPNLLSRTPVFISQAEIAPLKAVVAAVDQVLRLEPYRDAAMRWAPAIAERDFGPRGALMGFDFHLTEAGPRLIEINTNAGGAFLNAVLAQAQRVCCENAGVGLVPGEAATFESAVRRMFDGEWRRQRGSRPLRRIAIIDDAPTEQHLYPEFLLAKGVLETAGWDVIIADPQELTFTEGALRCDGVAIDLVYNRLVDFALEEPRHAHLRHAYVHGEVVLTPNPHVHALLADKRNLVLLSDGELLEGWGVSAAARAALKAVPRTIAVTPANAEELWRTRKEWFFKPTRGHASKGVYRGDKITTRVWSEIVTADYVAQAFAPPGERHVEIDGRGALRKVDVRLYTYDGEVLLSAARLYQGQTTNMRTPGGGFAPLFVV